MHDKSKIFVSFWQSNIQSKYTSYLSPRGTLTEEGNANAKSLPEILQNYNYQ